jgi:hypothetical protein
VSQTTGNMYGPWYDLWGIDASVRQWSLFQLQWRGLCQKIMFLLLRFNFLCNNYISNFLKSIWFLFIMYGLLSPACKYIQSTTLYIKVNL